MKAAKIAGIIMAVTAFVAGCATFEPMTDFGVFGGGEVNEQQAFLVVPFNVQVTRLNGEEVNYRNGFVRIPEGDYALVADYRSQLAEYFDVRLEFEAFAGREYRIETEGPIFTINTRGNLGF